MTDRATLEILLFQMGFCPNDFSSIRASLTREEAVQKLEELKSRFKVAFRKKIPELHPDRTNGDPDKTLQFRILLDFARELEALQAPPSRVVIHEVTFHNPPHPTRRSGVWAYPTVRIRTGVTSSASTLAGMSPSGVVSNRGR